MSREVKERTILDRFAQDFVDVVEKNKSGYPQVEAIMRDRTHSEQVIRWAEFVKTHSRSIWIREVGPLIDSQIIMANAFYERLAKTEGGLEKIRKLRKLDTLK